MWNANLHEIDALNQRGGRMLSVIDLVERGTIDADIAAYCIVAAYHGASFLCCALRGGAGKTALMGALLGLVPSTEIISTVASARDIPGIRNALDTAGPTCVVVHEIGKGSWFGYLWGPPVLDYIKLKDRGARLATSIHADDLNQVEQQLASFGGSKGALAAFDLVLFISQDHELTSRGDGEHVVHAVHERVPPPEHAGTTHKRLYKSGPAGFDRMETGTYHREEHATQLAMAREFVEALARGGTRRLDAVMPLLDGLYKAFGP